MTTRNLVLLLRHCVRSTRSTIKVCDEKDDTESGSESNTSNVLDAANDIVSNTTAAHGTKRYANISEFITAPLPKWDVPAMWCTERGMDIIEDLGEFLIRDVVNLAASENQHVIVNIVSDESHRDIDTSYALLKGMKTSLNPHSYSGLDKIHIDHEMFSYDTSSWSAHTACPSSDSLSGEDSDNLSTRLSSLPPTDFNVQEALDLAKSLGALDESIHFNNNSTCPGKMDLTLHLLKYVAHIAFYSRASRTHPQFLPLASDEDVYKLLHAADYVRSVSWLDNKVSAKRGLVMVKAMLKMLQQANDINGASSHRKMHKENHNQEIVNVTVFVGHDSNIIGVATALGLRWKAPLPFVYGSADEVGKIISVPPGSAIMFDSTQGAEKHVSMSFVIPVNLIGNTTNGTEHQLVPMYTIDVAEPEWAIRDDVGKDGKISMKELRNRMEEKLFQYPDLRACYEFAPTVMRLGYVQKEEVSRSMVTLLAAMIVVNVIGCSLFLVTQLVVTGRWRFNRRYQRVRLNRIPTEVELS